MLIVGGIILNSLGCAMLYHPVEEHMRLVEDPPEIPSELPPKKMIKTEFGDLVSASHRSSIISTVGSVTLDPRRDPRLSIISLSKKLARKRKQGQVRINYLFIIFFFFVDDGKVVDLTYDH